MKFQITLFLLFGSPVFTFGATFYKKNSYISQGDSYRNTTKISNQRLPSTFGAAKLFQPTSSMIIGAHCQWKIKFNTVSNRIPETITEMLCQQPQSQCGGNYAYQCRQIRSKILVGYVENGHVVSFRNNTINIGCSCVRRLSYRAFLLPPIQ